MAVTLTPLGTSLVSAALALSAMPAARAETAPERATVALKVLDYLDSQPGTQRVRVFSPSLLLLAPVGGNWAIGGTLTSDAISGASPAYHSSGLGQLRDHRNAIELLATRYFDHASLTMGANLSHESDYLSRGVSLLGSVSNESKNTTWTAGLGFNSDSINPSNGVVERERKRVSDLLLGLTQVLGTHDIAQINFGHSMGRGYFTDPYKVMDNRPRERNHTTLMTRWNHHFEGTGGSLRSSYRYYTDSYGVKAHTLGFEYVQPLPRGWTVTPLLRLYTQTAARFYIDADPATEPFPPNPPADAVYFTEDHRLSAFGARTFGVKLAKQIDADWLLDVKFERYGQRAAWTIGGTGSPGLAPFNARSIQVGMARQF